MLPECVTNQETDVGLSTLWLASPADAACWQTALRPLQSLHAQTSALCHCYRLATISRQPSTRRDCTASKMQPTDGRHLAAPVGQDDAAPQLHGHPAGALIMGHQPDVIPPRCPVPKGVLVLQPVLGLQQHVCALHHPRPYTARPFQVEGAQPHDLWGLISRPSCSNCVALAVGGYCCAADSQLGGAHPFFLIPTSRLQKHVLEKQHFSCCCYG